MKEFRCLDKHISFDGGIFTYRNFSAIGEGVVISRTGIVDLEDGKVQFHEINMIVDFFDKEYYHEFINLPRITEVMLLRLLRKRHF